MSAAPGLRRFHSRFLPMYSLSSCWNSNRHSDGRAMLREIRDLGFQYAELSHGIRISLLPGVLEAVDANEIKISTLHNFCPLPWASITPRRTFSNSLRSIAANAKMLLNTRSKHSKLPNASAQS